MQKCIIRVNMDNKHSEIDSILEGIFKRITLRELFEQRLHELKLTQTGVEKMLGISHRPLKGLLDATKKSINYGVLNQLAVFLNKTVEEIAEIHLKQLEEKNELQNTPLNKKKFIKENFDLAVLRKAGFIKTINDFDEIENRIKSHLNLNSIFDYKKRNFTTAFWAGAVSHKNATRNALTRDFWLVSARNIILKLDNPHYYNREELIRYFPEIRWHSTNVEFGLVHVIKNLFKLGITVIFQPSLSSLHLRGATFLVNDKPCIVLTDYIGFYPTLWHCLIHELYHVLFDLEDIKNANIPHLSDNIEESLTITETEIEADEFAKRYLFSEEKMQDVLPYMRNESIIKEIARDNNIHHSIIYSYYAYEFSKTDRLAWIRARRTSPPDLVKKAIFRLEFPLNEPIEEIIKSKKLEIYN